MTGQNLSLVNLDKTPQFRFILKTFYFRFGFLILKKEDESQETVPGSAGEDRGVALLRR